MPKLRSSRKMDMGAGELSIYFLQKQNPDFRLRMRTSRLIFEIQRAWEADGCVIPDKAVHAGTEKAYRPAPAFGALEQRQRARHDLARVARGRRGGVAGREGGEIGLAPLDGHRAREQFFAPQPFRALARHALDLRANRIQRQQVLVESVLTAR